LLPQKALYWQEEKALIVADLHIGKVNHFRRSGLAVPEAANTRNYENLIACIAFCKPEKVIFAGDLFHSAYNQAWEEVGQLLQNFKSISFYLTVGNHDVMSHHQYQRFGIQLLNEYASRGISVSHHPTDTKREAYALAGHIHPGFKLSGRGKQALTLPCFYFGEESGLLPAFGTFTGLCRIEPKNNDQLYIVADQSILKVY
jgi:DNA ligase-associated metallophosphoesterase